MNRGHTMNLSTSRTSGRLRNFDGPAARILVSAFALLTLVGCGIQSSRTIVGAPGPNVSTSQTVLFLVTQNRLKAVLRPATPHPTPINALRQLAAGPTAVDRASGFTTAIPAKLADFRSTAWKSGNLIVRITAAPTSLPQLAHEQIACTAAANLPPGQSTSSVRVTGAGRVEIVTYCSADPNN